MPAWYLLQLDPWQLSLKYLNSATELPGDSVAQLVRAWQAICQVVGSSPSLSHRQFLFPLFFLTWVKVCQVWSMSACASRVALATHPPPSPPQMTSILAKYLTP